MRACWVILDFFSSYSSVHILQQDILCAYVGALRQSLKLEELKHKIN